MSKEPIQLGHSVERHSHHDSSHHHNNSPENELHATQRINKQFGPDSLSRIEQILLAIFVSGMILMFLTIFILILILNF